MFKKLMCTNPFGCSDTKTYTITTNGTSLVSVEEAASFSFSPNPVDNNFTITSPSYKTIIYNRAGQKVMTFDSKSTQFNVTTLPRGFYFVQFELANDKIITRKFLKQ
jgi:hypothetical protein